jgi:hypothetical protein
MTSWLLQPTTITTWVPQNLSRNSFFLLFAGSRGVVLLTYFATYCNKVFLSIQTFSYYQRIQMSNPIYWNRVLCLILFKFRTLFSDSLTMKGDSLWELQIEIKILSCKRDIWYKRHKSAKKIINVCPLYLISRKARPVYWILSKPSNSW